jgi:hypothetical protein
VKIDNTKDAVDNVLALINGANAGQTLTSAQVTLGTPAVKTDTSDGRNTTIEATAVSGQGYSGSQTYSYTRLTMTQAIGTNGDATKVYTVPVNVTSDQTAMAAFIQAVATDYKLDPAQVALVNAGGGYPNDVFGIGAITDSVLYAPYAQVEDLLSVKIQYEGPWDLALSTRTTALTGFDAVS